MGALAASIRLARYGLDRLLARGPARDLSFKQYSELAFWRHEIGRYAAWYRHELAVLWDIPAPAPARRVVAHGERENAIRTWFAHTLGSYGRQLLLGDDELAGMRVLDLGCGPMPGSLQFSGCRIIGIDPLIAAYRDLGFPVDAYDPRVSLLPACAERLPLADGAVDAVIAVNAIDHVDRIDACAAEIRRVLAPGGRLRFCAQYHRPTITEPQSLDDARIRALFAVFDLRRVAETAPGLVVWEGK